MSSCTAASRAQSLDALAVGPRVEEADVLGDRAGEQLVVLHHACRPRCGSARGRAGASGTPSISMLAGGRLQQPEHQLDAASSCRRPTGRRSRPTRRLRRAGSTSSISTAARCRRIAEAHVLQLDAAAARGAASSRRRRRAARRGVSAMSATRSVCSRACASRRPSRSAPRRAARTAPCRRRTRTACRPRTRPVESSTSRAPSQTVTTFSTPNSRPFSALVQQPEPLRADARVELVDDEVLPGRARAGPRARTA